MKERIYHKWQIKLTICGLIIMGGAWILRAFGFDILIGLIVSIGGFGLIVYAFIVIFKEIRKIKRGRR